MVAFSLGRIVGDEGNHPAIQQRPFHSLSSTPQNDRPTASDETIRKPIVPESAEATDSQPDRSPGKTDRDLRASSSDSDETAEVIRELITPEAIAASTDSEGDRSPGKTDRDVIISESNPDEAAS